MAILLGLRISWAITSVGCTNIVVMMIRADTVFDTIHRPKFKLKRHLDPEIHFRLGYNSNSKSEHVMAVRPACRVTKFRSKDGIMSKRSL